MSDQVSFREANEGSSLSSVKTPLLPLSCTFVFLCFLFVPLVSSFFCPVSWVKSTAGASEKAEIAAYLILSYLIFFVRRARRCDSAAI